ncbi:MAG TPA: hypothetical protein VMB03_14070 [Bryobacteraceae bacterium]|nr:hypothetical protein [Bryobacteraceae bacterium]
MSRTTLLVWLAAAPLFGDVVALKDGRQISGVVESGNVVEIHVKAADQSQTIDIHDVQAIQFGASQSTAANSAPASAEAATAQPNTLILKDGTHVAGKWWSIDADNIHFLVNNQLQQYSRRDLIGVTFGNATLPRPPERSTAPATAPSAQTAAGAAPPAPQSRAPTLARPSRNTQPPAPRTLSQPENIGAVYYWNGKGLIPLEVTQAVEHKDRAAEYWELPGPQAHIRMTETEVIVFILRLPREVNPADYSLFALDTVNGSRRTRIRPGRKGGLVTWPVDIKINNESSLMTYALTVKDLPTGEYSFSPSDSNDGYCFGVDPATPGQ